MSNVIKTHVTVAGRRCFLQAAALGIASATVRAAPTPMPSNQGPPQGDFPRLEYVYEALVTIGPMEEVGETPSGIQRLIPITGGSFEGPAIRGKVLPGAADWNLQRNDGMTVVSAGYFLRTHDGVIVKISNQGVNRKATPQDMPKRPRFTVPVFEAPKGTYEWLNQSVFVGTLSPIDSASVQIRVFKLV